MTDEQSGAEHHREIDLGRRIEAGVLAAAVLDGRRRPPCPCTRSELTALVEDGRQARDELVLSNLGLVRMVLTEVTLPGQTREDLLQAGVVGLLEAVDRYDHRRPNTFATYALTWVRNLVRTAQLAQEQGFLPAHRRLQVRRVRYEQTRLCQRAGAEVTLRAAADSLGLDPGVLVDDALAGAVDQLDGVEIAEYREVPRWRGVRVDHLMAGLGEREQDFCRRRFGFNGEPTTLTAIAADWGWSVARVHRFERRLLDELRGIVPASWAA